MPSKGHYDVWPPIGQDGKVPDSKMAALKREMMNKEWEFPTIPTFETWCCITCYDTETADGGELFIKIMKWLLTNRDRGGDGVPLFDAKPFPTKSMAANNVENQIEAHIVRGVPIPKKPTYVSDSSFVVPDKSSTHRSVPDTLDHHGGKRGYESGTKGAKGWEVLTPGNLQPGPGGPHPLGKISFLEVCGMIRELDTVGGGRCNAMDNQSIQMA